MNVKNIINLFTSDKSLEKNSVQEILEDKISNTQILESVQPNREIDRIVVFFKNGSFKSYTSTSSV